MMKCHIFNRVGAHTSSRSTHVIGSKPVNLKQVVDFPDLYVGSKEQIRGRIIRKNQRAKSVAYKSAVMDKLHCNMPADVEGDVCPCLEKIDTFGFKIFPEGFVGNNGVKRHLVLDVRRQHSLVVRQKSIKPDFAVNHSTDLQSPCVGKYCLIQTRIFSGSKVNDRAYVQIKVGNINMTKI